MVSVSKLFAFAGMCSFALGCGGSQAPAARSPAQTTTQAPDSTGDAPSSSRPEIIALLERGSWGWPDGDFTCERNATSYRFSDDLTVVTGTNAHPVPNPETGALQSESVYDIDAIGARHIRMRLRGESRRTDEDALVVWDLVVLSRNSFCWHRTDWREGGCTDALTRCD